MDNAWRHFRRGTDSPYDALPLRDRQFRWLAACLVANRHSEFGRLHDFTGMTSVDDYVRRVPLCTWDDLQPWITRLADGENDLLFSAPVRAFEITGGSHSGGKLLPYTDRGLADFRDAVTAWLRDVAEQADFTTGHVYWALSPAVTRMTCTPGGIPVGGGDALYLGEEHLAAFSQLSAVPLSLAQTEDVADWQLLTLVYLLQCHDLRLISVWSPAFLFPLLNALRFRRGEIRDVLENGGVIAGHHPAADAAALARYERYLMTPDTRILWPDLKLISCWDQASSAPLARALRARFPSVTLQGKGLLSTEAVITIPSAQGDPHLCPDSNFYEFSHASGRLFLADELTAGEIYGVIVTTNSGLYRYQTGDCVRCTGHLPDGTPQLRFLGREGINSDLVGEKLTEPFVCTGLSALQGFAVLAADADAPGYVLLLGEISAVQAQQDCDAMERWLCTNPQYQYARRLGQLQPLTWYCTDSPVELYFGWQQRQAKRLGDIKIPALLTAPDWRDMFDIRKSSL